ncbi:right-handed parallel beta-helix repeat-containing protein [Chengkuizengella axinellae]|uniref:Pectinesterase family protein n=1 Tax=Chengkuizengella axinellae TaxID=3064388 RepID=A0ABT9IX00_9BACL|nr:right-handed parallel beta-helix repeat-containing protein [Chengkuizengella sp. 2205SS18-9]MDP5273895.1 pectinesterase family protein [Chengkuizengella sp. 2205SS18-9]
MIIHVPQDKVTITDAVKAASEGDTICIAAGSFNEAINIGVDKNRIRIIGAGIGKTIVDGSNLGLNKDGFNIQGSNFITIENLTVQNFSRFGLFIQKNDNTIHHIKTIENELDGVCIESDALHNVVTQCEAEGNNRDGMLVLGNHNFIMKCKMKNNLDCGLNFQGKYNLAFNNMTSGNRFDGFLSDSVYNTFLYNTSSKNGEDGFDTEKSSNFLFWNKALQNEDDGIEADSNSLLLGNESKFNKENGIMIFSSKEKATKSRIIHNVVTNNNNGVKLEGNENIVDKNTIRSSEEAGINILDDDNAIRSNHFHQNKENIRNKGDRNTVD